jgi:uncharacterized RDD family membrane protein YckC
VIKTCQHCGAVNGEAAEICCSCDAPLGQSGRAVVSRRSATLTEGNLAVEPEWRREVSSRLNAYRVKRGGTAASLQSALPFETAAPAETRRETPYKDTEFVRPSSGAEPLDSRKQRAERFEILIPLQQAADSAARLNSGLNTRLSAGMAPNAIYPVASLPERCRAALLDAALLLFSFGGMLALFTALGGRIGFNKLDAIVAGATLALFYAQYFALFTVFGGSTPGMMLRGLRVVSFDGSMPISSQMVWRSFGYLISAGTCFLGFVWALWDEDHLCWQDRISQTYLTPVEGFAVPEPPMTPERRRRTSR